MGGGGGCSARGLGGGEEDGGGGGVFADVGRGGDAPLHERVFWWVFFLRACCCAFPTIYFEELISKGASGECLCF